MRFPASSQSCQRSAVLAALALALSGSAILPAHAATVALSGTHMAAQAGSRKPPVTKFPSGTPTVYFDYTVVTPAQDTGQVEVFAGGVSGKPVASASLFFGAATSLDVPLKPASGSWADGSYCTVLSIDGRRSDLGGAMPIAWTVGAASPARCAAKKLRPLHIGVHGKLRARHKNTITITVSGPRHPIGKALVRLDGSAVGMPKRHEAYTNGRGMVTFKGLKPRRTGEVQVTASKAKFETAGTTVRVMP